MTASHAKMAKLIEIPFRILASVDPMNRVLHGLYMGVWVPLDGD